MPTPKLALSKLQRGVLLGLTAAVGGLLWLQIDEVGLAETPWIAGLLVIGALLVAALAPSKRKADPDLDLTESNSFLAESKSYSKSISEYDPAFKSIRSAFANAITEWSKFFESSVIDRNLDDNRKEIEHSKLLARSAALQMAYTTTFMAAVHHRISNPNFSDDQILVIRSIAVRILSKVLSDIVLQIPLELNDDNSPRSQRDWAIAKLVDCELAAKKSVHSNDSRFYMDAVFSLVDGEAFFGIKSEKDREDFYGIKFREELGKAGSKLRN